MAQTLGTLEVDIGADTSGLRRAEREVSSSSKRMEASFNAVGSAIAAAFTVETARQILMVADNMVRLEGNVKRLTRTTDDFEKVWSRIADISNANGAAIADTTALFQRFQMSMDDLVDSNDDVLNFVDTLQKVGRLGGSSAEEMSNALIQLSQGFAGGVIRAEEFNSIIEQMPTLLNIVAQNIEGVDGDIGKLRQAMLDGQLTSEVFFQALSKGTKEVNDEFSRLPRTIDQASQALSNNFAKAISALDNQIGASTAIADFIDKIADAASATEYFLSKFEESRTNEISYQMQDIADEIRSLEKEVENADSSIGRFFNDITGGTNNVEANKAKIAELRAEYSKLGDELRQITFGDRKGGEPLELKIEPEIADGKVRLPEPVSNTKKQEQDLKKQEENAQASLDRIYLASLSQKDRLLALETQQLDELMSLYDQGLISYEQYQDALTQTGETFAAQRLSIEEENVQAVSQAYDALNRKIGDSLGQALVGTQSFSDAFRSIMADLASQFISAGIGAAFGMPAGGNNLFGGLFGGGRAMGGQTSGMLAHPINERGTPEIYETGGQQYLLPTGKNGNISPMQSAESSSPNVSIISTGEPQEITATRMDNGEMQIMIDNAIKRYDNQLNSQLSTGKGKTAQSLQKGYNVTRNLGVR